MFETVSVDEAIKKGIWTVNVPSMAIMYGLWILLAYLGWAALIPIWLIVIGTILSLVFAWIYWSIAVTRWRLWAFENVRNVHELKKRAIKKKIIWKDNNIFESTELRTKSQKIQWEKLITKFNRSDVFIEDYSIPQYTYIYYSRGQAIGLAIIGGFLICSCIYLYYSSFDIWITAFLAACGIFMIYSGFNKNANRSPQIILSYDGIETADIPFYSWSQIRNEDTKFVHHGKSASTYFFYDCPEGHKEIVLGEFDINLAKLEKLLIYYRARYTYYQQKKNANI